METESLGEHKMLGDSSDSWVRQEAWRPKNGGAIDKPDEIVRLGTAKDEGITINVDIIARIVMVRTKQGDNSKAPTLTR